MSSSLRRSLSLLDATMINIGSMIGSGIFIVPSVIALTLQTTTLTSAVWIVGGIISLFGAFSVAELGALMPKAGGQYVYLKEAYGPLWGFLYGWSSFGVIVSAAISAVAVGFATYLGYFFPMTPTEINIVAIASILLLTLINCIGVKFGMIVQNGFTFLKIGALLVLVVVSFLLGEGQQSTAGLFLNSTTMISGFGVALISVLWAYDGWIEITYIGSEVQRPQRNIPLSIILSTLVVILLYVLVNWAYQNVLTIEAMASSSLVASDTAVALIGPVGATFVTLGVIISTFGCTNGFVFTGSRIYYAMAKEGLFFKPLAAIHPKTETPINSLVAQGIWSSLLVLSGTYNQLITYVIFASWIFYAMSAGAVMILRKRHPQLERPYKTWGYPFTPIAFIGTCLFLVINTIIETPRDALFGAIIILLGIPAYFYWRKSANVPESELTFGAIENC